MATLQHLQRVGAQSTQETWSCNSCSKPTVAPDSQPPTRKRKRKHRTLSPEENFESTYRARRYQTSDAAWHQAQQTHWDSLSRVWLASDALRELDRRNDQLAKDHPQELSNLKNQVLPKNVEQFARHGGPDLSDLRQYSSHLEIFTELESESTSGSGSMPSKRQQKSLGRKDSDESKRSSAYTPNFAQKLIDNGVFMVNPDDRAANHQEWNEVLVQPRPSLSPSRMSDGHYNRFVKAVYDTQNEDEVMSRVFTQVVGDPRYPSRQNARLGNLDPIAENVVVPQPDWYEGDVPGPGNRQLRKQLAKSIVPSAEEHYPFLPNFFAEVKGPEGRTSVAQRQACHDGALGARAMHRLENLGRKEEVFDNKARTATATFDSGNLTLFSHHVSRPKGPGYPSQTHMAPLRTFALADTPSSFRQGVGAFRNAEDYAGQLRKDSIEDAHRRNRILTPRPTRKPDLIPLSCQAGTLESSEPDSSSSSEEEEKSDDGQYRSFSKARPKRKQLKPRIVTVAPKRRAKRDLSPPRRRELRPRR